MTGLIKLQENPVVLDNITKRLAYEASKANGKARKNPDLENVLFLYSKVTVKLSEKTYEELPYLEQLKNVERLV